MKLTPNNRNPFFRFFFVDILMKNRNLNFKTNPCSVQYIPQLCSVHAKTK